MVFKALAALSGTRAHALPPELVPEGPLINSDVHSRLERGLDSIAEKAERETMKLGDRTRGPAAMQQHLDSSPT